jgi:CBS domain containing-hemolysin-like protein
VRESQEAGVLPAEAGRLLAEIFEFGDLTVERVMTPRVRVTGIPVGAQPADVQEILRSFPHARYPIFQDDLDHTLGTIHIKDLLRLIMSGGRVEPGHARPLPTVPETAPLDTVLATMRRERAKMALVIDEYGGTAGFVTLEDLFEEVIGKVEEAGSAPSPIHMDAAGRLRVPGTTRLDEVGERLSVTLEHEEVDRVSGLVLALLGRPPRVGDVVRYGSLEIEVTEVQGAGVAECAVSKAR